MCTVVLSLVVQDKNKFRTLLLFNSGFMFFDGICKMISVVVSAL